MTDLGISVRRSCLPGLWSLNPSLDQTFSKLDKGSVGQSGITMIYIVLQLYNFAQ